MADYGVNINLRVKGQSGLDRLNTKVKELTKSVDNIRQIDIMNPRNTGGAGGKGARNELKKYRQKLRKLKLQKIWAGVMIQNLKSIID